MRTTTKQDLIDRVAQLTEQRRIDVKRTISRFLEVMVEELADGNRIELREFGVFENRGRKGRTAQNPKTGQIVDVPPRRTVRFKVSRPVRQRLECASAKAEAPAEKPPVSRRRSRARKDGVMEAKPAYRKRAVQAAV